MAFGLDTTGFTLKKQTDITTELQEAFQARFGIDLNVNVNDPDSIPGQLIGIFAERFALLWEQDQAIYDTGVVQNAEGVNLDNLAAIIGLTRLPATATTAVVDFTGVNGTIIPLGSIVATASGIEFSTDVEVIIALGVATVVVTAVVAGATQLAIAAITVPPPIGGVTTVTNALAGVSGRNSETDTELRDRMLSASSITGSCTVDAIRARLLELTDVQDARVFENDTDFVDADGRPAHSFEAVIFPATVSTQSIADLLFANKPVGIATFGTTSETVVDSQDLEHTLNFSFAVLVPIDVNVTLVVDSALYPVDGDAQVAAAIAATVNAFGIGGDVIQFKLNCSFDTIPGITDVTVLDLRRDTEAFAAANVVIEAAEIASSDVVVVTS